MRKLDALTADQIKERHRLIDSAQHRHLRGTLDQIAYDSFVNSVDVRFGTPVIQTALDIVKVGKKFSQLTVVSFGKNKWGQTTALCHCDCGGQACPTITSLAAGESKSCGCLRHSKICGSGQAVVASVATTYKSRAKKLGIAWEIDKHAVRQLILSPCFYCGIEPYRIWNITNKRTVDSLKCNGIDRLDNDRGYTTDNVVPCCPRCNYAKREMSFQEFSAWAVRLAGHLQKHFVSGSGINLPVNKQ
jgi:hypothetical protein